MGIRGFVGGGRPTTRELQSPMTKSATRSKLCMIYYEKTGHIQRKSVINATIFAVKKADHAKFPLQEICMN